MLQRTLRGTVTGIDFSPVSVSKSLKVNTKAVEEGRCKVLEGNVANLPFDEGTFDLVTAFETIYFWPDIEHCFNEVKRVLKPGGQFVIVNESDGHGAMDAKWESMIEPQRRGAFAAVCSVSHSVPEARYFSNPARATGGSAVWGTAAACETSVSKIRHYSRLSSSVPSARSCRIAPITPHCECGVIEMACLQHVK